MEEQLSLEQCMAELEEVADKLRQPGLDIEEMMRLFERGSALAACCRKLLAEYKGRFEKINASSEGND